MEEGTFAACVAKGKEVVQRLLCPDSDLFLKFNIQQVMPVSQQMRFASRWSDEISAEGIEQRMRAGSTALEDLSIGDDETNTDFKTPRRINAAAFPRGHNIPVTLTSKITSDPNDEQSRRPILKMAFNIFDGVIILFESHAPLSVRGEDFVDDALDLSNVMGAVWKRLHGDNIIMTNVKKTSFEQAVQNDSSLLELCLVDVDGWLPQALIRHLEQKETFQYMSRKRIHDHMVPWLNFILVHTNLSDETSAVIKHCLSIYGFPDAQPWPWFGRLTLPMGHWAYYAMVGTDIGRQIVSFIASRRRSDELGRKLLRSITIFDSDETENSSVNEVAVNQTSPALLFEVVDYSEALCQEAEGYEGLSSEGEFPRLGTVKIQDRTDEFGDFQLGCA